jgi:hypothetical protein
MHGVATQPRGVFLPFDLGHSADHFQFRTIVEVAGFRALQPDHFTVFFSHTDLINAKIRLRSKQQKSPRLTPATEASVAGVGRRD